MDKISVLYDFLSRFKYLLAVGLGLFIVCFGDSNSFYDRIVMDYQIKDLKEEIASYNKIYEEGTKQLRALERDSRNIECIARERYFMKADDEDIFVLSTDPRTEDKEKPFEEESSE